MSTDYEGNQKRAAAELDSNGYHATDGLDGSPPFKKCRRGEGPRTELRLLMASKASGAIIGKSGANIKRLREVFKAGVTIPDCNGPERVLTVTAELGTALEVLLDILPRTLEGPAGTTADLSSADVEARLLIHQSQAGPVIGRAGSKIKELREETKTNIKVFSQCCPGSTDRVVQISGKAEAVVDTIQRVLELSAESGIKGAVQPYDPFNFNDFGANEYGGFGGGGGAASAGRMGAGGATAGQVGMMGGGGAGRGAMMGGRGGAGIMGAPGRGGMGAGGGMRGGMGGMQAQRYRSAGGVQGMADSEAPLDPTFAGQPNTAHSVGEKTTQQVSIPKDLAGAIIGPSGTRIRAIRAQSGAQIIIGKSGEGGSSAEDRIITITGTEEQVQNAQYLLQMAVRQHSGKY